MNIRIGAGTYTAPAPCIVLERQKDVFASALGSATLVFTAQLQTSAASNKQHIVLEKQPPHTVFIRNSVGISVSIVYITVYN
jgi:hypothetical protein